ncbi:MAG: hypothetical protein K5639_05365 [Eubacterium sp.]|nr:hypothetical protein [Eubacterium sp.]
MFKKNKPRTTEQLILWLDFLSITDTAQMQEFLSEHPEYVEIYARACEMLADREELSNMLAELAYEEDIVASINKTNESRIRVMKNQLKEKDARIRELEARVSELSEKNRNETGGTTV